MGSADIVPGVSGGTMALILGIYSRLVHAIKSFDSRFVKKVLTLKWSDAVRLVHWKFLLPLLSGILGAVLFFTKVVPLQVYMFTDPELIYGLFFGLIVGSIVILVKVIDHFGWAHALFLAGGALIGFWVVTLVPTDTSESSLFVFLSGAIAICAMILPGISGSYILLILGKYDYILTQIGKMGTADTMEGLLILIPFLLGAVFGLAVFSRLLSWLLDHHYARTLAVLIGFLIGSLYVIWPYQEREYVQIITKTEIVAYDSPEARELREHPPDTERPIFQRLGQVIQPKQDASRQVELQTVRQKVVQSSPFIPYITIEGPGTGHFWSGIIGMAIGLLSVAGLDYLRGKK